MRTENHTPGVGFGSPGAGWSQIQPSSRFLKMVSLTCLELVIAGLVLDVRLYCSVRERNLKIKIRKISNWFMPSPQTTKADGIFT